MAKTQTTTANENDLSELELARQTIAEQDAFLKNLTEQALVYGTVIANDGEGKLVVNTGGSNSHVNAFDGAEIGTPVRILKETGQIISLSNYRDTGPLVVLKSKIGDGPRWEVENNGQPTIVIEAPGVDAKQGDIAVLDKGGVIFTEILPRKATEFVAQKTNVKWDDIGGNDRAKQELIEAISLLRGGNKVFSAYHALAPKGILFEGPPGCGKTMLGKAAATELAGDGAGAFLYVKAPELLNMYVGATEARIRGVFQQARNFKAETGQSPLLFIDEADALLQKRGSGISSDVEKTIVPTFLTEMDGLAEASVLVVMATNRADTLDPAVIRDGRIDRRIRVDRPAPEVVKDIFKLNLRGLPIDGSADEIAEAGTETIFQPGSPLAPKVSGAMVAGVINRAKTRAVRRDTSTGKVSGIRMDDVTTSILEAGLENV